MRQQPNAADSTGRESFRLSFTWGATIEFALLLLAMILAWFLAMPLWSTWRWDWIDLARGLGGTIPMLLMFAWLMRAPAPALRRIREFIERALCPALRDWNAAQLLAISVLAGLAEEALFRALVQGAIAEAWGPAPALVLASVLFGICHWITPAYALIAGLMGCYLGGLWWWSGNLLAPVVAHAVYDFVALIWVLRLRRR
jgi:membrane protease YdiL (CAAX protease family)